MLQYPQQLFNEIVGILHGKGLGVADADLNGLTRLVHAIRDAIQISDGHPEMKLPKPFDEMKTIRSRDFRGKRDARKIEEVASELELQFGYLATKLTMWCSLVAQCGC